jgi:hypothetical protein
VATDAAGNGEPAPPTPDLLIDVPTEVSLRGLEPVILSWPAAPGRDYAVERAEAVGPGAAWTVVGGPIRGANGTASFVDPAPTGTAFYRVRVW